MDEEAAQKASEQSHPSILEGAGKSNDLRPDGVFADYDGIGRRAIHLFREEVVLPGQALSLEVLYHNEEGIAFWQALGFRRHAISFRIEA